MSKSLATAGQPIDRLRRCLAEGREPRPGDLAALLDQHDQLARQVAEAARLRRHATRNRAVADVVDRLYPDLGHCAAARRLVADMRDDGEAIPSEVARQLKALDLPTSERAIGDIIRSERHRNRH